MFGKLLIGLIGLAAGVTLAAWAETMDSGDSSDLEFDLDDEPETSVDEERDEILKEQPSAV